MKLIYEMMPAGWKETAKTEKALLRSRHISTPEELLRTYPQIKITSKIVKLIHRKQLKNEKFHIVFQNIFPLKIYF